MADLRDASDSRGGSDDNGMENGNAAAEPADNEAAEPAENEAAEPAEDGAAGDVADSSESPRAAGTTPCDTPLLTPGATVTRARLRGTAGQRVFKQIKLAA